MPAIAYRVVSFVGFAAFVGLAIAISRRRSAIAWRPTAWAIATSWGIGVFLLMVPAGHTALRACAAFVSAVLAQSHAGSQFLFGELGRPDGGDSGLGVVFAFQVLPTIVFIAALFAVLYYLGVMQIVVRAMAWVMVRTMRASGAEALVVAASVFMGQTEAPLTIRPYLARLTESELFTVLVAGMASVSGAILGAYVLIGRVPIEHLLTAVAMTAPMSLGLAKIIVPETDTPETMGRIAAAESAGDANVLDAATKGAADGLRLAANVGAMLLAFIALIALCNLGLGFVSVAGEALSLERVLGWVFTPFAIAMGVPLDEAPYVGRVLGVRTVLNEIVGFEVLRATADQLSARSSAIATVAICGFANVSSIGILIGGLGGLVPERRRDIARLGWWALIAATLANFCSACVAAVLL